MPDGSPSAELARIRHLDRRLHSFCHLEVMEGAGEGPLAGLTVGVKDVIDTAGIPTEAGSPLYRSRVPAASATCVERLLKAGATVVGKTVTAGLAFAPPGPTRNPWRLTRTPGGSSMGSAAAVAAGFVPVALGTQTVGSLIRPAAYCGVIAFKPSSGLISTDGVIPSSRTLDQVGCIASDLETAAAAGAVMAGLAPRDWRRAGIRHRPLRVAAVRTGQWPDASNSARRRFAEDLARLEDAGVEVSQESLPEAIDDGAPIHRTIHAVEAAKEYGQIARARPEMFDPVLHRLLQDGIALASGYRVALARRAELIERYKDWSARFDAIVTPAAAGEAGSLRNYGSGIFSLRWSLVGAPSLCLPTGLGPAGMPLGLQVVGTPRADAALLSAAAVLRAALADPGAPPGWLR